MKYLNDEMYRRYKIPDIFLRRYFEQNAETRFIVMYLEYMLWRRGTFPNPARKNTFLMDFQQEEIIDFYENNRLIIPQIEFIITTRCTLHCRDCSNLMYLFHNERSRKHIDLSFEKFVGDFASLIDSVDYIRKLNFLGGEPFLNQELYLMIRHAAESKKVGIISIITNTTLLPSDELLAAARQHNKKVFFYLSNYSDNDELINKLKQQQIIIELQKRDIKYQLPANLQWQKEEPLCLRGYDEEKIRAMFRRCVTNPCVCILNGKVYICAKSAICHELGIIQADPDELVDLRSGEVINSVKLDLINFYKREYFDICRYCIRTYERVMPAVQLRLRYDTRKMNKN
jgi:organic radical activating enzyme